MGCGTLWKNEKKCVMCGLPTQTPYATVDNIFHICKISCLNLFLRNYKIEERHFNPDVGTHWVPSP